MADVCMRSLIFYFHLCALKYHVSQARSKRVVNTREAGMMAKCMAQERCQVE
jgi:hypothetical protein